MTPLQAAARFAAFAWYARNCQTPGRTTPEQARQFARENWSAFLPVANRGLGRLLLHIARMPSGPREPKAPDTPHQPKKHRLPMAG